MPTWNPPKPVSKNLPEWQKVVDPFVLSLMMTRVRVCDVRSLHPPFNPRQLLVVLLGLTVVLRASEKRWNWDSFSHLRFQEVCRTRHALHAHRVDGRSFLMRNAPRHSGLAPVVLSLLLIRLLITLPASVRLFVFHSTHENFLTQAVFVATTSTSKLCCSFTRSDPRSNQPSMLCERATVFTSTSFSSFFISIFTFSLLRAMSTMSGRCFIAECLPSHHPLRIVSLTRRCELNKTRWQTEYCTKLKYNDLVGVHRS